MADTSLPRDPALLSDRDTTTPEPDPSSIEHRKKRQRPKRHRKRNSVVPGHNRSPRPSRPPKKSLGLKLQPIETTGLKGKGGSHFTEQKSYIFGKSDHGSKIPNVTFEVGSEAAEHIEGDIIITSSYPSLRDLGNASGTTSDQKSSQKTQSTSLTSMSSTSPRVGLQKGRLGEDRWPTDVLNTPRKTTSKRTRFTGLEGASWHGHWWEAYKATLVKPMSTCLLVSHHPSPHTQLIDHFIEKYRTISFSNTKSNATPGDVQLDLDFVAKCLDTGVNIDQPDSVGQTILMEAARSWHLDVIRYLIENEADVMHHDNYGRTPIHVATAANRPAVVHLLIKHGAFVDAKIKSSRETPLHLASRRGALSAIEALLERDANLESRDYKGRTPLHLAAEFGKIEVVEGLLRVGANPANVDDEGFSSLIHIIIKCPKYIEKALNSLIQHSHESDQLIFDPAFLEICPEGWREKVKTNCLLDVVENYNCKWAIRHTVIQTMIKTRWKMFGRMWALVNFFFRFVFFAVWTLWIMLIRWEEKYIYTWPQHWWRGLLPSLGVLSLIWEMKIEWLEVLYSIRRGVTLAQIRQKALQNDLQHLTHPCWNDEIVSMESEKRKEDRLTHWWRQMGLYWRDLWNVYDFLIFGIVIMCMVTHIVDTRNHDMFRARLHGQLGSVTILLLGIRLMKDTRGFFGPGQLVIMLGLMARDFGRFIFLYLQLYFPFTIAFWIIFGGVRQPYNGCDITMSGCLNNTTNITVIGMETYSSLCFSLFRLTLVDEYDLDTMRSIDPYMALLFITAFLLTSAVVGINFLIGLISNALGDGARQYVEIKSILQKLKVILLIEQTTYMFGPRPDQCCDKLAREHHQLDTIRTFKQDSTYTIKESISEVNKDMGKLKTLLGEVIQQQDMLLHHMNLHIDKCSNSNPKVSKQLTDHEGSDFEGNNEPSAFPDLGPPRPMSRAMKMQSGLDLSLSYNHKPRDVDAEDDWNQTKRRMTTSTFNMDEENSGRRSSLSKRIKIKD